MGHRIWAKVQVRIKSKWGIGWRLWPRPRYRAKVERSPWPTPSTAYLAARERVGANANDAEGQDMGRHGAFGGRVGHHHHRRKRSRKATKSAKAGGKVGVKAGGKPGAGVG